ncbi:MAG: phosphodiesterase [Synergistaceae bacterium]|nr:phosphodiesterase [Synergistaceae bacterium]
MNIMIASDIHGSAKYCRELMSAFEREKPDRILLLGDLLYHGPRNSLPGDYDTKETAAMLNGIRGRVMCVRGNCDAEVDQLMLDFPIMAEYCLLYVKGRVIFATHGHVFNTQTPPALSEGDILLHGHTHIPAWEGFGRGSIYVNPGSVSIPKKDSRHSYMMLNDEGFIWKDLSGEEYHSLAL